MKNNNTTIHIPKNMKLIVWKNKINNFNKIYLLGGVKIFKFSYNNNIFIDKWNNSIILLKNKNNTNNLKLVNKINFFLKSTYVYYFKKIKFKGKGFRIKFFKKIKLIKFFFGKSHKTFMFLKKIKNKKISKYKFAVFSINSLKLSNIAKKITRIKPINFYTLRGIRVARQIIFKRKGKKGTYI